MDDGKYYVLIDEHNNIKGFYCDKVHSNIPEGTLEISFDNWMRYKEDTWRYKFLDGEIIERTEDEIKVLKDKSKRLKEGTREGRIATLEKENLELKLAIVEMAETNEQSIIDMQLALAEVAEIIGGE